MSTQVAKKKETAVATNDLMDAMFEEEGAGVNFDVSEMEIPYVRLAHPMSEAMQKAKPAFIKELRAGEIYNTITKQIWDPEKGITVIPVHQETIYAFKTDAGGYERYNLSDPKLQPLLKRVKRDGAKEWVMDAGGNVEGELVKSDNFYCMILNEDGTTQKAVIDFRSTGLKVSRRWKTQIAMQKAPDSQGNMRTPPLFGIMWNFTGIDESNDRGSWSSWSISRIGQVDSANVFAEAKAFREMVLKGEAKAQQEEESTGSDIAQGTTNIDHEDDIPF